MRGTSVPLHVHSDHSAGEGTATVAEIVARAVHDGWPALALTDVETLSAQVHFHHAARASGIHPITGVELRRGFDARSSGETRGRLVLLARGEAGYASLCRVVSARRRARAPTPPPLTCLATAPEDVWFLSDDPATIEELREAGVAREDLRFLLVRPGGAPAPSGVAAVADTDVVMLTCEDHPLHALLRAIRSGRAAGVASPDRCLPAPAEIAARFADAPESLAGSLAIAESCTLDLTRARAELPRLDLPAGTSAADRLAALVHERRARGRATGRWAGEEYATRLAHELEVVGRLALAPYFLVAAEVADHVRAAGLPMLARGSVAASLLAHVLGLSTVDPLAEGLRFERFLHAGRRELPDIDLDVPSAARDAILAWIAGRFGADRTVGVATHATFRRRSAWREGLRALGVSRAVAARVLGSFPPVEIEDEVSWTPPLAGLPPAVLAAADVIERLPGRFHHLSVHPGGVVITAGAAAGVLPLERAPGGSLVAQYDQHALARLGFVKLDVLGNRGLDAIREAEAWIGHPVDVPGEDEATIESLRRGDTLGVVQLETPAMRSLLRRLPLRRRADLTAALALVRPGPASGEAKSAYLRRAHGEEPARAPHPRLAALLEPTFGLFLYEEDLTAAIALLTGRDLERADALREEIVTAGGEAAGGAAAAAFAAAAASTGLAAGEIATAWEAIARFAAYSFHRAHAASVATLAWRSAFLASHHHVPFACGVLNSYGGHYPLRTIAADFVRRGVPLLAPAVNASGAAAEVVDGRVRLGLGAVKGLTRRSFARILAARPFADAGALLRAAPLAANELEALVLSGACDGLAPLAAAEYPLAHEDWLARARAARAGVPAAATPRRVAAGPLADRWRALVRARNEIRFLGMHPSAHPMELLRDEAGRAGAIPIAALASHAGRFARVAVVVASSRRLAVDGGRLMKLVALEDETGIVEAVLFPAAYAALGDPITQPGPFLAGGVVETERRDVTLRLTEVLPFHLRAGAWSAP